MSTYDDASLIYYPSGYKAGTAYSLKPTDGSGDLTFTRASSATRVNAEGLIEEASILGSELIDNGDFANGLTDWTENGGSYATIVSGALNSNNPDAGNWFAENISQNVSFVNGTTYKLTFKAKNISGNLNLRITQNANPMVSLDLTSAFVDYTFFYTANADNGSIRIFCNSAVGQFQIDDISVKEVTRNNVPRIDFTGGGCGKLLLEPQRTNLLTYSNLFTDASWGKFGTPTISGGILSPNGVNDAFELNMVVAQGINKNASTTAGTYTSSIWIKGDTSGTIGLIDGNGAPASYTSVNVTTQWQRVSTINTKGGAPMQFAVYRLNSGQLAKVYIWNAQCELGSYPTSYIPTTSTAVTRVADDVRKNGISSLIGQTEGVFYFEFDYKKAQINTSLFDTSLNNNDNIYLLALSDFNLRMYVYVGGVNQVTITTSTIPSEGRHKVALAYKENDCAFYLDGVQVGVDTSCTIPTVDDLLLKTPNQNTQAFMTFPTRKSNAELATLTTL